MSEGDLFMKRCPFCNSENTYFSKKRKIYVCEDCDKTFSEQQLLDETTSIVPKEGLELFFSYGHDKNRLLVERIKQDMEKRGHHVWIDTNEIKVGDHWRDDILNGVLNASRVIAFLSEHSTRNPGVCLDELKIAVCVKGAAVKTVLLEPENKINPPTTLSDIQWLDMSAWQDFSNPPDFEAWYKDKFAQLCHVVESRDSVELSGDIYAIKTKLMPYLNSEKEYKLLSKEFYGRRWLEDYIEKWKDLKSTKALVLFGPPGSGKSSFSVNYSHYNADVYGCFLCEWNHEYTINPNHLIRTIAFRLATKLPDYRKMLLRQLETDSCLEEMDAEALFNYLLGYPLSHLVDGNRKTGIIVVDGLDEAENDGENHLAEVFAKCVELLPRWIRFIFTSRPEKSVIKYFHSYDAVDIIYDMPAGYNDIMAYLVKSLAEELHQIPNRLELLSKICTASDGIFLYSELLVTDIKNGLINISEANTFPKGLNAFYRLSMERKFPNQGSFINIRNILELLSISEVLPEDLVRETLGYSQYTLITCLDSLGSWVNRHAENDYYLLGFSHKSLKDWFTNSDQSGNFYVDYKNGAIKLARNCKLILDNKRVNGNEDFSPLLMDYIKTHIGSYYIVAGKFTEFEDFLLKHNTELDPYWRDWNKFPSTWDNSTLLDSFWNVETRDRFLHGLQREGNVTFLLWIFELAEKMYGIGEFPNELVSIYMDTVHMSGQYAKAVSIANEYLKTHFSEIRNNEFLAMLSVRRLHHAMFFKPVTRLLDDAMALYEQLDDRFPVVYNELLFLIGGNLGVLYGDWEFCREWLDKSIFFAEKHDLKDFKKRNARKMADYYCHVGNYEEAIQLLKENVAVGGEITGRYEAYLVGSLANVYTCIGNDDIAIKCYEQLLKYTTAKGLLGWVAHANLGIANVNFKLGNLKEAIDFAKRAKGIYNRIQQEWGLIMSEVLLAACDSRIGIAPIQVLCDEAILRAERMQYGSCVDSIKELCKGTNSFLKLYFL